MPHRGRLNLLTGLLEFPARALFHKVRGGSEIPAELLEAGAFGDVISHLVSNPTLSYGSHDIKVSHLPNPSHLEAVDPVALGKTRAKQFALLKKIFGVQADTHTSHPRKQAEAQAQANAALAEHLGECYPGDKVLCVQMHGDASFTGQGVVMESLGLSESFSLLHEAIAHFFGRQFAALHGWRYHPPCCEVCPSISLTVR